MPTIKRTYSQITTGGSKGVYGGRKIYKAKARKANNGVTASSALVRDHKILSTSKVVTMRYQEQFSIDSTLGGVVPGTYVFCANGLYDPNTTGTGHQPRGFDQLMAMYRRYEVLESLLEVWADPADLNNSHLIALSVRSTLTPPATRDDMLEHRTCMIKAVAGSDGGPSVTYQKIAVNPGEFLGMKNDDTTRGDSAGNPISSVYFHVSTIPLPSAEGGVIHCQARLTYKVKLSEPREPIAS